MTKNAASRRTDRLPIELCAQLEQARTKNTRGPQPGRTVRRVHAENCARVEHVVDVEHALKLRPADADDLREPHVELVETILEHRLRLDQRDAGGARRA